METPIDIDFDEYSESSSDDDHEFSGSDSSSFDSDFDPETLRSQHKRIETPRPSLTELQGILEKLNLDEEFMLEDIKMEMNDNHNDNNNDKPKLNGTRNSLSNHDKDCKEEQDIESKEAPKTTKSPPPQRAVPDLPQKQKRRSSKETIYSQRKSDTVIQTDSVSQIKIGKKWYINQYLCYKYLGKGSFGKVALAKDIIKNRKVAIKVLNKSLLRRKRILRKNKPPTNMLENIFREIAIMKKLDHPNVLTIYEVIDDPTNDKLYMVIDYMDNGSVLGEQGAEAKCEPMTDHELIRRYIRDMILGLDYLHANDIIHGDIKPENILLSSDNHCKIADFGVSFILDSETCPNNDGKISRSQGTPAFTAPETGSKSFNAYPIDIWAMGVTLYMMITGICPFAGNGIYDTYEKIQNEHPPIPQNIHQNMADFLKRILSKDPKERITLKEAMVHPWITQNGKDPLHHPMKYPLNKTFEKRVSITKEDIEYAVSLPSDTIKHLRKASMDIHEKKEEEKEEEEKEKESQSQSSPQSQSQSGSESESTNDYQSMQQPPKQNEKIRKKPKKKLPQKAPPQQNNKKKSIKLNKKQKKLKNGEYNPFSDTNNQNNIIVNLNEMENTSYSSKPIKLVLTKTESDPIKKKKNDKKNRKKNDKKHTKKKSVTPKPKNSAKSRVKSKKTPRKPSRDAPIAPKSKSKSKLKSKSKSKSKTPTKPTKKAPNNTIKQQQGTTMNGTSSRKSTPNIGKNNNKKKKAPKNKALPPSIKQENNNMTEIDVHSSSNISPSFVAKRRRSSDKKTKSKGNKSPNKKKGVKSKVIAPKKTPPTLPPKNKPLPKSNKKVKQTKNPTN